MNGLVKTSCSQMGDFCVSVICTVGKVDNYVLVIQTHWNPVSATAVGQSKVGRSNGGWGVQIARKYWTFNMFGAQNVVIITRWSYNGAYCSHKLIFL